jgi:polyisoprenoid-binding protein YceI
MTSRPSASAPRAALLVPRAAFVLCGALCLQLLGGPAPAAGPAAGLDELGAPPAGVYQLDPTHASLIFRVDHLGLSDYTARFKRFDAELTFDPASPADCAVEASIEVASLETDFPDPGYDFNAELTGPNWLDATQYPTMTFRSTRVELTGERSARLHGTFTLRGIMKPVTLEATFNGGYAGHPMDPGGSRIGFSAQGTLKRSDFGIDYGVPPAGSTLGVSDAVEFVIEAEFLRPAGEPAGR